MIERVKRLLLREGFHERWDFQTTGIARLGRSAIGGLAMLKVDDFVIDTEALKVYIDGRHVSLTLTELRLLLLLLAEPGRAQSRATILRTVWGHKTLQDARAVDTCISRLREKVGSRSSRFETLRGVGYRYIGTEVCDGP